MNGIILACQIENIASRKDLSVKIILGTQEMSEGHAAQLFALRNKIAAVYISAKESISEREIKQIDAVDAEMKEKTPSRRLRAVLFVNWKQEAEGHKEFETYYRSKMELYIENLKNNLQ